MMMSVIFRSLSSSKWARTPALKKILLWPIRNRFPSSSRALIFNQRQRETLKGRKVYLRYLKEKLLGVIRVDHLLLKGIYSFKFGNCLIIKMTPLFQKEAL